MLGGAALVAFGAALAWQVLPRPGAVPSGTQRPAASHPGPTSAPQSAHPATALATDAVSVTRTVTVRGTTVTVLERYTASAGDPVVLTPGRSTGQATLLPLSLVSVAQDGSQTPFSSPVTIPAGGNASFRGVYRLRYCPDLVPVAWPVTATVSPSHTPVQVTRSDVPLREAAAVCPGVPPSAVAAGGLHASAWKPRSNVATLRLRWHGPGTLTVVAVGAPGGFPLQAVGRRCGAQCVTQVHPGATASLQLRPVENCPTSPQRSDGLPLLVRTGRTSASTVVAVSVPGLGRWFSGACP